MTTPTLSFHDVKTIRVIRRHINGSGGPFGTITIEATSHDGSKAEFLMYVADEQMDILEGSNDYPHAKSRPATLPYGQTITLD